MKLTRLVRAISMMQARFDDSKIISVDPTYACNLSCKQCYFYNSEQGKLKDPFTDEEIIERLKKIKKQYKVRMCTWLGGEPMLKRDLIEKARKLFTINWIVTNGTFPIPDWEDCFFWISIDGNRERHDENRGKGVYDLAMKNAKETKAYVFLQVTVSKESMDSLEDIVKDWMGIARGMITCFYLSKKKDSFTLSDEEKNIAVDRLLELKKKYGDFIMWSEREINWRRPQYASLVKGDTCLLKTRCLAFKPNLEIKYPCTYEGFADCEKCGCNIASLLHAGLRAAPDKELGELIIKKFT